MKAGLSPGAIGAVHAAVTLTGVCGVFSARFTGRAGIRRSAALFFGTAGLSCLLLAVTDSTFLSVSAVLALRLASSLFQPLQMELQNRIVTAADRATALSIQAVIMDSTAVLTNLSFGALAQLRLETAFLWGAGLCLLGYLLFWLWHRKNTAV